MEGNVLGNGFLELLLVGEDLSPLGDGWKFGLCRFTSLEFNGELCDKILDFEDCTLKIFSLEVLNNCVDIVFKRSQSRDACLTLDEFVVITELFKETLNKFSNTFDGRKGSQLSGELDGTDTGVDKVTCCGSRFEVLGRGPVSFDCLNIGGDLLVMKGNVLGNGLSELLLVGEDLSPLGDG